MRRKQEGYLPFNDDKPKDAENPPFKASSLLVVKATPHGRYFCFAKVIYLPMAIHIN